eukprot:m.389120 g.389120  ORF g.389120 m.389120 type:complete len:262 (+) comp56331_c0_seq11:374-1159(+)
MLRAMQTVSALHSQHHSEPTPRLCVGSCERAYISGFAGPLLTASQQWLPLPHSLLLTFREPLVSAYCSMMCSLSSTTASLPRRRIKSIRRRIFTRRLSSGSRARTNSRTGWGILRGTRSICSSRRRLEPVHMSRKRKALMTSDREGKQAAIRHRVSAKVDALEANDTTTMSPAEPRLFWEQVISNTKRLGRHPDLAQTKEEVVDADAPTALANTTTRSTSAGASPADDHALHASLAAPRRETTEVPSPARQRAQDRLSLNA